LELFYGDFNLFMNMDVRAAYLCGREPNFKLTDAEKQELQLLQWEDFLEQTRQSILNKSTP